MVQDRPTRVCIVARGRLRSGDFIAALQASLTADDPLDIIIDRRHGAACGVQGPEPDRRRQPHVDVTLLTDGFALVPATTNQTEDQTWQSLPLIEVPTGDEEQAPDSVSRFRWRVPGRSIMQLLGVLIGVMMAALAASILGQTNLGAQLFTGPLADDSRDHFVPAELRMSEEPERLARKAAPPARSDGQPVPSDVSAGKSMSLRDASRTSRQQETNDSLEGAETRFVQPGRKPREGSSPPSLASRHADKPTVTSKVAKDQSDSDGRPELGGRPNTATPAPSVPLTNSRSSEPTTGATGSSQSAGGHRAELLRTPVSRGWGDSYVVRVSDAMGQPIVAINVWLVAHSADGTVDNVAMGALPDPGTYRATLPTGRSTPVTLHVRVRSGEKLFEVPVSER
jgi:hypothetical protein